ncbi:MAG: oligosaccharide flippase family protein [Odoribacter sp.]
MAGIKSLAKDTAIYGMSSIIGKFLNWCLTPLYTYLLVPEEYGIIVNLYAWIGLMLVCLTYGLETGFFRFANDPDKGKPETIYSTCMTSIGVTTMLFLAFIFSFLSPISDALQCERHHEYIWIIALIICLDVFSALPFAYLRYRLRPLRFASLKLLNIALTIAFNLFFLLVCPAIYKTHPEWIAWFYNPNYGAGYILVSNLIASFVLLLTLTPEIFQIRWHFRYDLLKQLLRYSFPLLILGLAGIMNQNLDKILYPYLVADPTEAMNQLGIYGANAKIAVVMIMFTQAFRYAYEPFIFAKTKGEDKRSTYALAMKYFIIVDLLIFLGVMFYLDIIRYFIDPRYFAGLKIVPIIMLAELFSGIFFNLSLWYKLTDRTQWGVYFSLIGLVIIVSLNVLFVPRFGYIACAWAAFACYFTMMFFSWIIGQHYYPINYNLKSIGKYVGLALILYGISTWVTIDNILLRFGFRSILLVVYAAYLVKTDLPLKEIPLVNRFFKKH